MKLLQLIDSVYLVKAGSLSFTLRSCVEEIHIYCLSDSPLLGMANRIDRIRKKHTSKIIIFLPASVPRASIDYMYNVSVIPYCRTLLRMLLLLKAALYTNRYDLIRKNKFKESSGKYAFYQTLRSENISKIATKLQISPKTVYSHRTNYTRKILGFKHRQVARLFFIGCNIDI
ncbi:two-component transcriptional regulator, LuxR family [Edwardsiella piscicida]|nr:two-component transcriptional regulator, LuxR family [Edwardsiella piscicida]